MRVRGLLAKDKYSMETRVAFKISEALGGRMVYRRTRVCVIVGENAGLRVTLHSLCTNVYILDATNFLFGIASAREGAGAGASLFLPLRWIQSIKVECGPGDEVKPL